MSPLYIPTSINIYCCANMWHGNIWYDIILLKYSHCDLSRWLCNSKALYTCVCVCVFHSLSRAEGISMLTNKLSPRMDHWTFLSSPFCDWMPSLSRFWLKRRMRAPGSRAMQAMASSCRSRSQENKSSSDDTSDSMTPVWTQMKLYGRRPEEADNRARTNCAETRWVT